MEMYGVKMKVPRDAEEVLRDMYGDGWREPRAKGYKVLVCGWLGGESRRWIWGGVAFCYIAIPFLIWLVTKADRRLALLISRR